MKATDLIALLGKFPPESDIDGDDMYVSFPTLPCGCQPTPWGNDFDGLIKNAAECLTPCAPCQSCGGGGYIGGGSDPETGNCDPGQPCDCTDGGQHESWVGCDFDGASCDNCGHRVDCTARGKR
jgi:hypothetical protein